MNNATPPCTFRHFTAYEAQLVLQDWLNDRPSFIQCCAGTFNNNNPTNTNREKATTTPPVLDAENNDSVSLSSSSSSPLVPTNKRRKLGVPGVPTGKPTNRKCSSSFVGVSFHSSEKVWSASRVWQGKTIRFGKFQTEMEAVVAHDVNVYLLTGDVDLLNFGIPSEQEIAKYRKDGLIS